MKNHALSGVFAAAITPLKKDFSPALDDIPPYLSFLAKRGCHGALLLGTTGEGPSFEAQERIAIFRAALQVRQTDPDFKLLAGTGTPSLEETILLTKSAFDLGMDGVVVLPPYYFHQATEHGLFAWFAEILQRAVPRDGHFLGYHFPTQSRVPLTSPLLLRLVQDFPTQFVGIKDSSSNAEFGLSAREYFKDDFKIFIGNEKYFSQALQQGSAGCITALANLFSTKLRILWDEHHKGQDTLAIQQIVNIKRTALEKFPPFGPSIKSLVSFYHGFPQWAVRPPLLPLSEERLQLAIKEMQDSKSGDSDLLTST